jgi:hypothetical protein
MRNPLRSDCRRFVTGASLCFREASGPYTFPAQPGKDNLTELEHYGKITVASAFDFI